MSLCDDFINVPVGGTVTALLPKQGVIFNIGLQGYEVENVIINFTRTSSKLFNNLSIKVEKILLRIYSLYVIIINNGTPIGFYSLVNNVLLDIIDNDNNVIAKAMLRLDVSSPVNITLPFNITQNIELSQNKDITNLVGYFEGFITLTGNGLLKMLPLSLKQEINPILVPLYSSVVDIVKIYHNRSIDRMLCDIVIKIPSLILIINDLLSDPYSIKVVNKIKNIIDKLTNVIVNLKITNLNLKFIYEINKYLFNINKIIEYER